MSGRRLSTWDSSSKAGGTSGSTSDFDTEVGTCRVCPQADTTQAWTCKRRRLYAGVVQSMALYGAPVWPGTMTKALARRLASSRRVMAIRMIRGYHTVSGEAASFLARLPPWDLELETLATRWRRAALCQGETPLPRQIAAC